MHFKNSCHGNILFLILIAVALFAALSYAVTSSSRSGGGNASKESAQLSASRVLNFGTAAQVAIQRMMAARGLQITDIRLENDVYKTKNGTLSPGALGNPANPEVYLFHPSGGGLPAQTFADISVPCSVGCTGGSILPGHPQFVWTNIPDNGSTTSDPSLFIASLSDEICNAINNKFDIQTIPNLNVAKTALAGSTSPPVVAAATGSTTADLDTVKGKTVFCLKESASPFRNIFIQVLKIY